MPPDPEEADFVAEYGRPDFAEVASMVGLTVRLRLGGPGAPPRSLAWGEAVRRVAHAVNALAGLGALLWLADGVLDPNAMMLGWVAAYLALVLGYRSQARGLAGVSLVVVATTTGIDLATTGGHTSRPTPPSCWWLPCRCSRWPRSTSRPHQYSPGRG